MKEKYIVSQEKNGNTYLTVKFSYKVGDKTKTYTKTFSVSDYPSKTKAMQAACKHRDIKRAELLTTGLPDTTVMHPRELLELSMEKEHLSSTTKKNLLLAFDRYLDEFNEMSIQQISPITIEESMANLRFTHSQAVINQVACMWRKIFKTARRMRLVMTNPMDEIVVPKSKYTPAERTAKITSDEEIDKVINELAKRGQTPRVKYNNQIIIGIILVMRYTGIRPSECFALTRENIDFENQLIKINSAYGSNEKGKAIVGTKTRLSHRQVPMSIACAMTLRSIMAMSGNDYIFTMYNGKLPEINVITSKLTAINQKLGTTFHLYANRHQFSSDLITNGVDPRTVMELMGHSSTDMTVGTYARSNIEKKRNALVEIGRKSDDAVSVDLSKLS
jgi:integrase